MVVGDLPGADIAGVVARIEAAGGRALGHHGDLRKEADIVAMVEATLGAFGDADILVNNAAAISQVTIDRSLETMTADYWDDVMAINVRGAMALRQACSARHAGEAPA